MSRRNLHQKDSISQYICPENGFRGHQISKGITPKNHMKENRQELREVQNRMREERDEAARTPKELYKMNQFKDVASKVFEPTESENRRRSSFESKEFLARGVSEKRREELARENRIARIELDNKMEEAKYYANKPNTPRKASVPRADELNQLAPHSDADYINRNKVKAIAMAPVRKEVSEQPSKHAEFGRVPEYIEERKAKLAEQQEEARRRMPDPNCPKGMCVMPEEERVNTLEILQQSKLEAMNQLRRMPFVIETPSQRKRQEQLETKMREIDSALAIFSKPKVYIALEK